MGRGNDNVRAMADLTWPLHEPSEEKSMDKEKFLDSRDVLAAEAVRRYKLAEESVYHPNGMRNALLSIAASLQLLTKQGSSNE